MSPRYQLVLQWPAASLEDFDALVALEEELVRATVGLADVDGHDFGSGEANVFVHTDHPQETLKAIQAAGLLSTSWRRHYRAGYRELTQSAFTILHPPGSARFTVS